MNLTTMYQREKLAKTNSLGVIVFPSSKYPVDGWTCVVIDCDEHRLYRSENHSSEQAAIDNGRAWARENHPANRCVPLG